MKSFEIHPEELGEIIVFGAVPRGSAWAQAGWLAVLSFNEQAVWATPSQGRTSADNFTGDLRGRNAALDWLIMLARREAPAGGRLFLRLEGLYRHVGGRKVKFVSFRLIQPTDEPEAGSG